MKIYPLVAMSEISSICDRYNDALDGELDLALGQRQGLLYNMMRYQMGWADAQGEPVAKPAGHRVQSVACLISCEALSGDFRLALPAAAGLELVNTFTIVHGDVRDGVLNSEEKPSVWWVWGPGQAINVGDGLHALGRTALFRLGELGVPPERVIKALGALDEACIRMCEGQHMDLAFQERADISVAEYLAMADRKAGAFMACAMELGALVATGDPRFVDAFKLCGRKLGVSSQIREDIRGLWPDGTGESASPAVFNKKKTYPIVRVLEEGDLKDKRRLGTIYFKRVLEQSDVEEILSILNEVDARASAEAAAESYLQEALVVLDGLNLGAPGLDLVKLGRYMAKGTQ